MKFLNKNMSFAKQNNNFDVKKVRADFPILSRKFGDKSLIYFDNAATTQKPRVMIDSLVDYYSNYNANIHRGVHRLSVVATVKFEETRELIAKIYGAKNTEVIFTKNDTESNNLIALTLGKELLRQNLHGNIVVSEAEHHSNIVPWQKLVCEVNEAKIIVSDQIRYLSFDSEGYLNIEEIERLVDSDTIIFACTWASNTFGLIYDIPEIIKKVRQINPNTIIVIDAAQYVPHAKFDFANLDADFITFSAHKVCGPTGVGILIGKKALLSQMPTFLSGGDMIKDVSKTETQFNDLPYKFEAGTPNIADVIAFGASLRYLEDLGWKNIQEQEKLLTKKLYEELSKLDFIDIYGPQKNPNVREENTSKLIKLPLIAFNIHGVHAHDAGTLLDEAGIAVRTGHHCTQLIMKKLQIPASIRASLYFYNNAQEIEFFVEGLRRVRKVFE
jgi:cysteine desulfurase/selenocysteine lyase